MIFMGLGTEILSLLSLITISVVFIVWMWLTEKALRKKQLKRIVEITARAVKT